jgi:sigma-B regulation protein RsbU (phosphoserine phosphatase)
MNVEKSSSKPSRRWLCFAFVVTLIGFVYGLYGVNMVWWRNSPDFGWRTMYDSGPNIVAQVLETGQKAGLRVGDEILTINGKAYSTFEELYFKVRHDELGSVNTYAVMRDGKAVEISITTGRIGVTAVLWRSGALFMIGLVYVMIGILVLLMKPQAAESWVFLVMSSLIGIHLSYSAPSDLMHPLWLFDVRLLIQVLYPAPIIHLAITFPKKRGFFRKRPWLWVVPYVFSLVLFFLYEINIEYYWDPAPVVDLLFDLYLVLAVLCFLICIVWNFLKDVSVMIRRQSQVILVGITLGFVIPMIDLLLRFYWDTYLFPDPTLGFVVFLILFPLSIGYTIVKYDLFAIDAFIKRTYGYILTTGAIAGTYGVFVLLSNLAFGRFGVTQSPVFPLIFVLGVVFLFNPVRNRVQKFIDRVFYRLEYDYQTTVQRISETMRSLMDLDKILKAMMDFALGAMFIDSGCVILLNREKQVYECVAMAGEWGETPVRAEMARTLAAEEKPKEGEVLRDRPASVGSARIEPETLDERELGSRQAAWKLAIDDPLIGKIAERGKEVTVYDIQQDPFFEDHRETCLKTFDRIRGTLIVPLIYEDKLTGLISLGQKKSGKFYRREDVNLLNTLANQGAVAIENAMLLEEVIEKERMEQELEVARDLQTSMLPATCPEMDEFELAALSVPARQVGGDFFDFIDMGKDKLGLVVGDVTGKGVSGALVMSASRSVFRMLSEEELTVGEIMTRANRRTKKDIKTGMFVALLYAVLNARDRTLSLCTAGQTQPVHLCAETGAASLVQTKGDTFPLGILDEVEYQETRLQLAAGDRVVFYTDGIVEAMNEKQEIFGFNRLLEIVRGAKSMTADSLLNEIRDSVNTFASGAAQHDDITLIVVSVTE